MKNNAKKMVAWLSVVSNTLLIALKVAVGISIHSVSVISEAIHSGIDLVAAVIALFAISQADKPADREHPFGHGKAENISGTVEAALIFGAAVWIMFEAIRKFSHADPVENSGLGVGVMFLSMFVNIVVSTILMRVAKREDSVALEADAWHLRTDVYTSGGVMLGLALIWIGELVYPGRHFHWIDPVAAIIVALLITRAAWDLTLKSAADLLDRALPPEEGEWIQEQARQSSPLVKGLHHFRTRKAGSHRFVELHLMVNHDATVEESHDITEDIADRIRKQFPHTYVTIHVEPCKGACKPLCLTGCLLDDKARIEIQRKNGTHPIVAAQSSPPTNRGATRH